MARDGAETQFLRTLERLNASRFEAFVVLSRGAGERYDELAATPIVQWTTILRDERRLAVSALLDKTFKLAAIIKATRPAIIHSWLWYSNFLCGLMRRVFRVSAPLIVSQRGDYYARYGAMRLWLTEKLIYRQASYVLTNSERIREDLQRRYPGKPIAAIRNIINPPEAPRRSDRSPDLRRIVSVGRLDPEKGHRYLIQALHLLQTRWNFSDFRAVVLGEGNLRSDLERLIEECQLSKRIQLLGFCDEVFSVLADAAVFVLPSLHESSPNALIEAMSVGLPCVASAVGGVKELIDDGEDGLLVPPADAEALSEAIYRLLTDCELASRLGKNAQRKIQQMFNSNASIQQLEAIYQDCLTQ
jgi:glycosyltransferase involved in cell wall biosynthesis